MSNPNQASPGPLAQLQAVEAAAVRQIQAASHAIRVVGLTALPDAVAELREECLAAGQRLQAARQDALSIVAELLEVCGEVVAGLGGELTLCLPAGVMLPSLPVVLDDDEDDEAARAACEPVDEDWEPPTLPTRRRARKGK